MASDFSAAEPASAPAAEVSSLLGTPSLKCSPSKATVDTPPSTPAAELRSTNSTAAPNITKEIPATVIPESLHHPTSDVVRDSDLEDGELVQYDRPTTSEADSNREEATQTEVAGDCVATQQININAEGVDLPISATEEHEDEVSPNPPALDELNAKAGGKATPGPKPTEVTSADTEELFSVAQGSIAVNEADSSAKKEEFIETAQEAQTNSDGKKETVEDSSEVESVGDDEHTAVKLQSHEHAAAAPSRSFPPHMRPAFKAPNAQPGPLEGRPHWPAPAPHAPRGHYFPVGHQPSQPPLDYDELQRVKAQLIKARSDLDVERKVHAEMRKTVGAEKQASIGAAMADMLSDLLQKQADALTAKAKSQEKERDLQYREQKITQFETYLSNGQKQLKWQLEQQGVRTMSEVDEANLRREVELKMKHQLSDIEGKIAIQVERLHHQEAAQKLREQHYKALIRGALETEIREQLARDMQANTTDSRVAEIAYEPGLAESKRFGNAKGAEAELKQGFLKGYAACYRTLTAYHNMRNGNIAADSPELAFLYDLTHPENPHNIGVDIGRMEVAAGKADIAVGVAINRRSMEEGVAGVSAVRDEPDTTVNVVTHSGRGQALFNDTGPSCSSKPIASPEQARLAHHAPFAQTRLVQQVKQEEPARSCVPPRSTFAGELRDSISTAAMPEVIFASTPALQATPNVRRTTAAPAASSAPRAGMVDYMGQGVYAGHRTIRDEKDFDDGSAASNLIDLY